MRFVLLSALLLTGCDSLFGLTHLSDRGSGADDDAAVIDDAAIDAPNVDAMLDGPPDAYVQKTCMGLSYLQYQNGGYYRAGASQKTWTAAELDCQGNLSPANNVHTHLVVLTDDQEANIVWVNVLNSPPTDGFWIGLSDQITVNNFRWVTDEPVSYPVTSTWDTNEPTGSVTERCVHDSSTIRMSDISCNELHTYACECDSYPTNSSF